MAAENNGRLPLTAVPGSRLAELLANYDEIETFATMWAERLKTLKDAIKAETLTALDSYGGSPTRCEISAELLAKPLQLSYVESWRVDAKKLKAEDPHTYVRYAVKSGRWELRRS